MRSWVLLVAPMLLLPMVSIDGLAHSKRYVNPQVRDETAANFLVAVGVIDCGPGSDPLLNPSVGGFCFGTADDGDLPPDPPGASDCVPSFEDELDPTGECTISLLDDLAAPVHAFYCQNLDDDPFCGGAVGEPVHARTEPGVYFCGSITINAPLDPTPRSTGLAGGDPGSTWIGNNWDPASRIIVFLSKLADQLPLQGNPVQNTDPLGGPCGTTVEDPTTGFGFHS